MKNVSKRLLSVILVLTVALGSSLFAFADTDLDVAHATVLSTGTTQVTEETLFRFVPVQTGYYLFKSDSDDSTDPYIEIFDADCISIRYCDDSDGSNLDFDFLIKLEAGKMYYIQSAAYENRRFNLTVTALGGVTSARLISKPDVTILYDGLDYEIYYNSKNEKCIDNWVGYDGMSAEITFDSGSKATVDYHGLCRYFTVTTVFNQSGYSKVFSLDGINYFSIDFTFMPNPVESIEVVSAPDRTDYVFGVDGDIEYGSRMGQVWFYPIYEIDGLEVKINYTDGTSKTVNASDFEDDGDYAYYCDIDGRSMYVLGVCVSYAGKVPMDISYMGHSCSFDINIKPSSIIQHIYRFLFGIYINLLKYFNIIDIY